MIKKIDNRYYVYDKNGKIVVITTNRKIAEKLNGS